VTGAVRVIGYGGWTEVKRDLLTELFGGRPFRQGVYLFRGQGRADDALTPSFDRRFAQLPLPERMALWERLVVAWREACRLQGRPEADGEEHLLVALGQHHGLPTRLLDWSASPYVAAFFAFTEHLLSPAPSDRVALWVLHLDHPAWTSGGVSVLDLMPGENARLLRQRGRFTLCRAAVGSLEEYAERFAADGPALTQCVLPASEARVVLADLDAMGVNDHALFGDLPGLARLAVLRALLDQE